MEIDLQKLLGDAQLAKWIIKALECDSFNKLLWYNVLPLIQDMREYTKLLRQQNQIQQAQTLIEDQIHATLLYCEMMIRVLFDI